MGIVATKSHGVGPFQSFPVGKALRLSKSRVLKFISIDEVFRYTTIIITFRSFMSHLSSIQSLHSISLQSSHA